MGIVDKIVETLKTNPTFNDAYIEYTSEYFTIRFLHYEGSKDCIFIFIFGLDNFHVFGYNIKTKKIEYGNSDILTTKKELIELFEKFTTENYEYFMKVFTFDKL